MMNIIGVEHSLVYKIMRELKQMGFDATPVEDENDSNMITITKVAVTIIFSPN